MNEHGKRGRPTVVPGEASIEVSASVELPLYRRLRLLAQSREYESVPDVVRAALRAFCQEKIDGLEGHS